MSGIFKKYHYYFDPSQIASGGRIGVNKLEIWVVNLIFLLYLFRTAIPQLKYPFLFIYFVYIFYSIINFKHRILLFHKNILTSYLLIIVLILILAFSFSISNKLYLIVFKDMGNAIILLSFIMILHNISLKRNELKSYFSSLINLIVIFGVIVSIFNLLDLLYILPQSSSGMNKYIVGSFVTEPNSIDYNFALLPVFFGMISVFSLLNSNNSLLKKTYYYTILIIFYSSIVLSGSRRGIILMIIILFILVIFSFITFIRKESQLKKLAVNYSFFLFSVILFSILLCLYLFYSPYSFKTKTLDFFGSKNIYGAKNNVSMSVFRYLSPIKKSLSFPELHERIWKDILDSKDPNSGWGNDRTHKVIFPLTGKNVEIVPSGAMGLLMDSTCNATYYQNSNISDSYSLFVNLKVVEGDKIKASVYCYVSENLDINVASFGVGSVSINNNIVSGNITSLYDLGKKGIWQKLAIDFRCKDGEVPLYMSFWKKGVSDFSKLKGYIIFAYPNYEKNKYRESKGDISSKRSNIRNETLLTYTKPLITNTQNFLCSFNVFNFPLLILHASIFNENQDPVRTWVDKFISEDTTYLPFQSNIFPEEASALIVESRIQRWKFAIQIFDKEYSIKQKIFGGGFRFLNWYGYFFLKDKTKSDYPHNPFLSVLLYSGIIGLLLYCFFMYKVFYYYIKYIKEYPLLFIFFIITFFFNFFSGGSPFDHPIMGFFSILPFYIHAVHKKDERQMNKEAELSQ